MERVRNRQVLRTDYSPRKLLGLALALIFLFACAGPSVKKVEKSRGVYHRVKKGETLWSISKIYHADILDLVVVNKIDNPNGIEVDSVIFVPGADHVEDTPSSPSPSASPSPSLPPSENAKDKPLKEEAGSDRTEKQAVGKESREADQEPVEQSPTPAAKTPPAGSAEKADAAKPVPDKVRFIWPMKGKVTAKFGAQPNGLKYNGIKIAAREGTPVVASAAGEVMFAAPIKYYGETIIIKHDGQYTTVYTFVKSRKVKTGDRVRKGEQIASLGKPENGNGRPYLNFEIRQNHKPRNPLLFLP